MTDKAQLVIKNMSVKTRARLDVIKRMNGFANMNQTVEFLIEKMDELKLLIKKMDEEKEVEE